jgi:hypothetical protein
VVEAAGLIVLTPAGDRISAVTRFLDSAVFGYFGLPGLSAAREGW